MTTIIGSIMNTTGIILEDVAFDFNQENLKVDIKIMITETEIMENLWVIRDHIMIDVMNTTEIEIDLIIAIHIGQIMSIKTKLLTKDDY